MYLANEVDHVGPLIPEWELHTRPCVNVLHSESFGEVTSIPNGILALTVAGEACREELVGGSTEHNTRWFSTSMGTSLLRVRGE